MPKTNTVLAMTQPVLTGFASDAPEPPKGLFSAVIPPLSGEYLYAISDEACAASLSIGSMLHLPLGSRQSLGFVISINTDREKQAFAAMHSRKVRIRTVSGSAVVASGFSPEHLAFFEWIARYYAEPLSRILDLAIPNVATERADPFYQLTSPQPEGRVGLKQRSVLELLERCGGSALASRLRKEGGASAAMLRGLISKGYLEEVSGEPCANTDAYGSLPSSYDLTEEQRACADAAIQAIHEQCNTSLLLHGVTGSGKTEVYLQVITEALRLGKSALVIVPEIALTPQLLSRFEARLGCPVAVLHSSLRPKDRWNHWSNLLSGKVRVAIGARSAIFAPLLNIGAIIVDEEHDPSFKQGEGIRYNARDLALVRAKLASCPIILGSATPSLETFHHAISGKHRLFKLDRRYYNSPPLRYQLIDLNRVKPWEMPSKSISPEFLERLKHTLQQGEQAFVLYNRRGFANYLQCERCEYVIGCPHCSVTLTYHRKPNSLLCHFCGFSSAPLIVCPACGSSEKSPAPSAAPSTSAGESAFIERGGGTERVFEELQSLLPTTRIAKLDRDAVQTIADYTDILDRMRSKEIEILVGTQMIAKGHDLPDVTFVGVVDCDVGLHMPDFRAGERVFQLLTQVAGRAGRREKQGYVVLQTRVPNHTSLAMTVRDDYRAFAEGELLIRKNLGYPPYQRLLRVIISSEMKTDAERVAAKLVESVRGACLAIGAQILGPSMAPIERTRNYWRYHVLFKAASAGAIQHLMSKLKGAPPAPKGVRISFDIDPQDML